MSAEQKLLSRLSHLELMERYYRYRKNQNEIPSHESIEAVSLIMDEILNRMQPDPQDALITDLPLHQMSNDVLFIKQGILNKQSADVKAELLRRLENA